MVETIKFKDKADFISKIRDKDKSLMKKIVDSVIEAKHKGAGKVDIFHAVFENNFEMSTIFSLSAQNYDKLLNDRLQDFIETEDYEYCAKISKALKN